MRLYTVRAVNDNGEIEWEIPALSETDAEEQAIIEAEGNHNLGIYVLFGGGYLNRNGDYSPVCEPW